MRKAVVEIACGRCQRVEYAAADADPAHEPVLRVRFLDVPQPLEVVFEDLCAPCRRAVRTHLTAAVKRVDGLSPDRRPRAAAPAPEDDAPGPPPAPGPGPGPLPKEARPKDKTHGLPKASASG